MLIKAKYIISSRLFLTGFLNLTIDKAPTNPKERAILVFITDVIPQVITGSKTKERDWLYVDNHLWFVFTIVNFKKNPHKALNINFITNLTITDDVKIDIIFSNTNWLNFV
tara:strand:- start:1367 stop:1699 length:333 start_codon:yes stop_codon:yes gene_type:complete